MSIKLKDGSKVAIIGGGPAGTFFAHFLHKFAQTKNLELSINIFDGKDFIQQGPRGCNMCAGIVSENLIDRLAEEDIFIPEERVQRKIDGYFFQTKAQGVILSHPLSTSKIITVFRGNGPRFFTSSTNISFDDFLLDHVRKKGVNIFNEIVSEIILPHPLTAYAGSSENSRVKIIYGRGREKEILDADLLVGAFGLNTQMIEKMKHLNFGYEPPETVNTCQSEIELDPQYISKTFFNNIYTFSLGLKNVRFAAIIPKSNHVTVSLIGKKSVNLQDLIEFINHQKVRKLFPKNWQLPDKFCHCYPKIPINSSSKPFSDRLVIIGDASISRYYKNGLESAFVTARLAAYTAIFQGISSNDFKDNYFKPAKKIFSQDNFFGDLLFRINDFISQSNIVTRAHLELARKNTKTGRLLQQIYWNMFTGNITYRAIFVKIFHPWLNLMLIWHTLKVFISNVFKK